jgi:hypothetical protein
LESGLRHGARKGTRSDQQVRGQIEVLNHPRRSVALLLFTNRTDCWFAPLRC